MHELKLAISLCGFGFGLFGTSIDLAHAITVGCPLNLTATWVGAPFGTKTNFTRSLERFQILDEPTDHLGCHTSEIIDGAKLTVVVQLGAGAIPALCGGRATISGFGFTVGGVPPFGGFPFSGARLDAVPTYDQSTGRCQLDLPIRAFVISVDVSDECEPIAQNAWECPGSTTSVGALFEPRAERFASLNQARSPEIFRILRAYDAFAKPAHAGLNPIWQSSDGAAPFTEL